jgi:hypothetical protein
MQLFDILGCDYVAIEYEQIVSAVCSHKCKQGVCWNGVQTVATNERYHQFQKASLKFEDIQ